MKVCTKCKQTKSISEFSKNRTTKDGKQLHCKACVKHLQQENAKNLAEYHKQYRLENAEKLLEQKKQYYKHNTEKMAKRMNQYYKKNVEKIIARSKLYYKENLEKIAVHQRQYGQKRLKTGPLYKFAHNIRTLVRNSFKKNKGMRKSRRTESILGCTVSELRDYLEKQFQPGMTFENHGEWHVDHRIPLASATSQNEIEKLCHYTNLQPLWAKDNLAKGKKLIY